MTTDPPTTPAGALRWATHRLEPSTAWADPTGQWNTPQTKAASQQKRYTLDRLLAWADELDAAPTTVWALPLEPGPEVTTVWSSHGARWDRDTTRAGWWLNVRTGNRMSWQSLLATAVWLSTEQPEIP